VPFSISQLRHFVAVAEAGQVSAAARELYVSQSAVTMAIQEIERVLQQPAFIRGSRGMQLTETGRVRVGVSYPVMAYFLPYHLRRLAILFPNLEVDWREMSRPEAEAQLADGALDFGLLLTSNVRSAEIQHETFVHSPRRLWMAPSHPLAGVSEIHLADVAPHPYIQLTVDEAADTTLLYWGSLRPNVFVETSSIEAVRSIVANGNGVTILSDMVYRPWSLEGKRVHTVVVRDPVPDMRIGLAWRRRTPFIPPMTALYEYFHRQFSVPAGPAQQPRD